ncbi:hypothetical protein [Novipirellula maiorica]|uniref:hypothetical protein n=1 Tax=Novipirellula maiorica TaxID=1265734 RepID=UPI00059268EB|nr:hypothetical protein [Rhodopirellula maiorica]
MSTTTKSQATISLKSFQAAEVVPLRPMPDALAQILVILDDDATAALTEVATDALRRFGHAV